MKYDVRIKTYGKHKVNLGTIEGEEKLQKFIYGFQELIEENVESPDDFTHISAIVDFKLTKRKGEL